MCSVPVSTATSPRRLRAGGEGDWEPWRLCPAPAPEAVMYSGTCTHNAHTLRRRCGGGRWGCGVSADADADAEAERGRRDGEWGRLKRARAVAGQGPHTSERCCHVGLKSHALPLTQAVAGDALVGLSAGDFCPPVACPSQRSVPPYIPCCFLGLSIAASLLVAKIAEQTRWAPSYAR